MTVDKTTILDLGILASTASSSIYEKLCFATTNAGKDYLLQLMSNPLNDITKIEDRQKTIQFFIHQQSKLANNITNGTLMVLQRFYDTHLAEINKRNDAVLAFFYKLTNSTDYSLIKYSVLHFIPFIQTMQQLKELLQEATSQTLSILHQKLDTHLSNNDIKDVLNIKEPEKIGSKHILNLAWFFKNKFKHECLELIDIFCTIDAYQSLAKAQLAYNLTFPIFSTNEKPFIQANKVFHLLLSEPISINVEFGKQSNFLFLTGANMSGKSTFIKSIGVAVYLAHLGFGVPAKSLKLSLFDGIISNINITDDINAGESYFFNEVKRIKSTVEKIQEKGNWLILIDELFKGTNIQDAMRCSTAVVEGLAKINSSVFVLSTHLYEIAADLQRFKNLQFHYFETNLVNEELVFNYNLKPGISNDRFGYLILQKEGVLKLLASPTPSLTPSPLQDRE